MAVLVLGTFINALLLITFVPQTLSEFDSSVNGVLANLADDGGCCVWNPKGGGDHKTGTVGIIIDGCFCSSPVETLVSFGGTGVFFIALRKVYLHLE